jgi:hypothetical protein
MTMKPRTIFLTYFLLTILLLGSAVIFAYEIKDFMRNRGVDPTAEFQPLMKQEEEVIEELNQKQQLKKQEVRTSFAMTQAFTAMATPKPRPTQPPRPEPSPTPIVPAKNWKINLAAGSLVSMKRYDDKDFFKRVGDVLEDTVHGNFKILAILGDAMNPKVKIQHIQSGTIRIMDKEGNTVQQ